MSAVYNTEVELKKQIRRWIRFFIVGLVLSGVTAFPIERQLNIAHRWITYFYLHNQLTNWIDLVYKGAQETNLRYPFLLYGTDSLVSAHLVIAIFFGPLRDPVKNRWVIEFGMIACIGIFPLAMITGAAREMPLYWRWIDCLFGVIGGVLLWICHQKIRSLEKIVN